MKTKAGERDLGAWGALPEVAGKLGGRAGAPAAKGSGEGGGVVGDPAGLQADQLVGDVEIAVVVGDHH